MTNNSDRKAVRKPAQSRRWPRYKPSQDIDARLMLSDNTVRWINEDGIILVPAAPLAEFEQWNGRIAIAGYIDRLHVRQIDDAEFLIAELVGQPRALAYHTIATAADLHAGQLSIIRERTSADDQDDYTYPVLIDPDSSFAMLAQDALVSGLAVDLTGMLAEVAEMDALDCGLLLKPHAMTVFSAG